MTALQCSAIVHLQHKGHLTGSEYCDDRRAAVTQKPNFQTPGPIELNQILAEARAARAAAVNDGLRALFSRLRSLFGANGSQRSA